MPEFGANPSLSATDVPLTRIQEMKMQGLSNNQIIQTLQRQGYTSTQIFDALSQSAVQPPATVPGYAGPRPGAQPLNSPPAARRGMEPMMPRPPSFEGGSDTEEMIEAIIDEKWNDLMADINKVISWKEATEARITKMEQQMTDLKDNFDKLQQAIVGKVGEYDQHILEVGAEVKAMEKVFSKVLPVFTDNVAELSRVADQMKRNAPAKK
jgi:DNA-binding transcriptional MerR regulator